MADPTAERYRGIRVTCPACKCKISVDDSGKVIAYADDESIDEARGAREDRADKTGDRVEAPGGSEPGPTELEQPAEVSGDEDDFFNPTNW